MPDERPLTLMILIGMRNPSGYDETITNTNADRRSI